MTRTDMTATTAALIGLLDCEVDASVVGNSISVCDGEWRYEGNDVWRFFFWSNNDE